MPDFLIMITTVDNEAAATALSRSAVAGRLAATGQVTGPVTTTYRHHGEVCEGTEWQVTFRTTEDRAAELEEHVVAQHPYDNPEMISLPILSGPLAYLDWITRATRPAEG
ncbi:divalent-cation tolerance protein CutA [Kitasatospora sp. NPDC058063]|uniref:divalent-cation tolerance protein CutA n=1 Tax=unclassified Kitasatospora TaxID=2633591 RepID=UPI0036DF7559